MAALLAPRAQFSLLRSAGMPHEFQKAPWSGPTGRAGGVGNLRSADRIPRRALEHRLLDGEDRRPLRGVEERFSIVDQPGAAFDQAQPRVAPDVVLQHQIVEGETPGSRGCRVRGTSRLVNE